MNCFSVNPFSLAKRIKRPLIFDGAMGSLLQQKGFATDDKLWTSEVNINAPEAVIKIHRDYIEAGADIITTNTFRTNPYSLEQAGIKNCSEYVKKAVNLAKKAAANLPVFIAGSNAPAEDCYQKERNISRSKLEDNHRNHIDLLIDNNVDFILNETQSHFDEIQIICKYCSENDIPFVLSLYLDENLNLLSGEVFETVLQFISEYNPLAIGINCISIEQFSRIINSIDITQNWGFYLNCGAGNPTDKIITCGVFPEYYSEIVKDSLKWKPSFIGSCCGSSPEHIKAIKRVLDGKNSD